MALKAPVHAPEMCLFKYVHADFFYFSENHFTSVVIIMLLLSSCLFF